MPERADLPMSLLPDAYRKTPAANARPLGLEEHVADPAAAVTNQPPVLEEINSLIDAYEIDVQCSQCDTTVQRTIAWLHKRYVMNCPECRSVVVLRTSVMTEEIRRVSRQLRELQSQLVATVGRANSILGR